MKRTEIILLAAALPVVATAEVPEPDTVLYGQVVNQSSGQDYLLTEGTLTWRVAAAGAGGREVHLATSLRPLAGGAYSYRLNVPQGAAGAGLTAAPGTLPLGMEAGLFDHVQIAVNGHPARVAAGSAPAFEAGQGTRAATHRVDLEVDYPLPDSDGDGLPDWWEERHGLDIYAHDAGDDADADGATNGEEFFLATDPNAANTRPLLASGTLSAYAGGTAALLPRTVDSDSAPEEITFRLTGPPGAGEIILRPEGLTLGAGDTFTQADVDRGRVVLALPEGAAGPLSFAVEVADGDPGHAPAAGEVAVEVHRPSPGAPSAAQLEEASRFTGYPAGLAEVVADTGAGGHAAVARELGSVLGRGAGAVVIDGADLRRGQRQRAPSSGMAAADYADGFVATFGPERPHLLAGGFGGDDLRGGMADDRLVGGPGNDVLAGGGGRDHFIFLPLYDLAQGAQAEVAAETDTVLDFDPAEGDVIDLSYLLAGVGGSLDDLLVARVEGGDTVLEVGGATGVRLAGHRLDGGALRELWEAGHLLAGAAGYPSRIAVAPSTDAGAPSETGPAAGAFTLTRTGFVGGELRVGLEVGGSARNGIDYQRIPAEAVFAPGMVSLQIPVVPFTDNEIEPDERVEITVAGGASYDLAEAASARLTITDLEERFAVAALQPLALREAGVPGMFLLTRSGQTARNTSVVVELAGSAVNGRDFAYIAPLVNFAPGQTVAAVNIQPLGGAGAAGAARPELSVRLRLGDDPASTYTLDDAREAWVTLADRAWTYDSWAAEHLASAGPGQASAAADADRDGAPNLLEYAFGSDPGTPAETATAPRPLLRDGHLTLAFRPVRAAVDLATTVEVSADGRTWLSGPEHLEELPAAADGVRRFRDREPATAAARRFLRLRVTRPELDF